MKDECIADLRLDDSQSEPFHLVQEHYNYRHIFLVSSVEEACRIIASDSLDGDGELYGCFLEYNGKIIMNKDALHTAADRVIDWWLDYGPEPDYTQYYIKDIV